MKGQEIKAEERDAIFGETPPWIQYLWRSLFGNKRFSLETLSLEKAPLDALSLKKPL